MTRNTNPDNIQKPLVLGTRGSLLARTQSQLIADALETVHPGLRVSLHVIKTSGDQIADRPLHEFGGKGLFTRELELALLAGQIDFAVHSFKDVPVTMPLVDTSGLVMAAVPQREDARDVLATRDGAPLADLPSGARVGTGSLRRQAQLLAYRSDLTVVPIRGNVDTRLRKLDQGEYDAVVLALAGVRRARLFDATRMTPIDTDVLLPAPAQGALALQCRAGDQRVIDLLIAVNDPFTSACAEAEREVVRLLQGDCHSPIAAYATMSGDLLKVEAAVAAREGHPPVIRSQASGPISEPLKLAAVVFEALTAQGAARLLRPE